MNRRNELARAVIDRGKYEFQLGFKWTLCRPEGQWFLRMKEPDRARHLKKVATLKLWEADLKEPTTTHQPGPSGVQSRNTGGNI